MPKLPELTIPDLTGRTFVVTGANGGIGRVMASTFALHGATVHMVCRNRERGQAARDAIVRMTDSDTVHLHLADLSVQADIRHLASELKKLSPAIDVLVNNAGVCLTGRHLTADGLEMTFATNHLGYFMLTGLLLSTLKQAPAGRILSVGSAAHVKARLAFDNLQGENSYKAFPAYAMSKLCNLMHTFALARRLEGTTVTANCVHPGVVGTGIYGKVFPGARILQWIMKPFVLTPEQGADTTIWAATQPDVAKSSGKYLALRQEADCAKWALEEADQERLWKASEELTGFPY